MNQKWFLDAISERAGVKDYLIAQEQHKDGGYHIHAYFKFDKKLDRDGHKLFDVTYYRKDYVPNIQKPKSLHKVFRYIKKTGNYITNIEETRPAWLVLLEDSQTEEEFLYELMWKINRIDNYSGYRTLRDLFNILQEKGLQNPELRKLAIDYKRTQKL